MASENHVYYFGLGDRDLGGQKRIVIAAQTFINKTA